jgi:hypothetical protein
MGLCLGRELVFKAHRLLFHSTLGLRVINRKKRFRVREDCPAPRPTQAASRPSHAASERRGNSLKKSNDIRTENASSQGQHPAWTGVFAPYSSDSGWVVEASPAERKRNNSRFNLFSRFIFFFT